MQPFTVLLLLPDDMWDGDPFYWVRSMWVSAPTPAQAVALAKAEMVKADRSLTTSDLALIAIYPGHLTTCTMEMAA